LLSYVFTAQVYLSFLQQHEYFYLYEISPITKPVDILSFHSC